MDARMSGRLVHLSFAAALVLLARVPYAQALVDPTRPPGQVAAQAGEPGAVPVSRLQSVLISKGRKYAVIDGVQVALGGKVGEATLVRLSESEAVLRNGKDTEVLKLLPGIEKKPVRRKPAAGRTKS
jgi:MSHA biogenesis protein MshK